ncbi:MAG: ABC transporter ATP-binding protein [Candidatus Hydrothermae bacterium]|nr:ABC transporter ATP-binding protein [Candidatus Hydrothermae bacterium]
MIEVLSVSRYYGSFPAVQDVTFQVQSGEILGFLGPNGAGKTTTMRLITGFLRPTRGDVRIHGVSVVEQPLEAKCFLGYLPEDNPLYPEYTPREYLTFRAGLYQVERVQEALDRVVTRTGIADVLDRPIGELSKGYRQRVGLAAALLHDPEILILDEPTTGLDPLQIVEIRELIRELGQEKTILLSTHILPEVQQLAHRVIIIHQGRIVAEGTPEELARRTAGGRVRALFRASRDAVEQALRSGDWVVGFELREEAGGRVAAVVVPRLQDEDPRERLFRTAVEHNLTLLELGMEGASLEEVFVHLTEERETREEAA